MYILLTLILFFYFGVIALMYISDQLNSNNDNLIRRIFGDYNDSRSSTIWELSDDRGFASDIESGGNVFIWPRETGRRELVFPDVPA